MATNEIIKNIRIEPIYSASGNHLPSGWIIITTNKKR